MKDGHTSQCKECILIKVRLRERNPETKEKRRIREKKPEIRKRINQYAREYRKRPQTKKYYSEYYQRPKIRERYNQWMRKYRKTNFQYKLSSNIGKAIKKSIRKDQRGNHWEDLVGYSLDSLKSHLEKKFLPGMTWKNYGEGWQIDHLIPISVFNFEVPEDIDFRRCWALKNLRPLWAHDNLSKGVRIEKPFQPSLTLRI